MYICVEKDNKTDYVGNHWNALYYLISIGRRRVYRQTYPTPQYKELRLLTFKRKENAQELCNYVNKIYNAKYEVFEIRR